MAREPCVSDSVYLIPKKEEPLQGSHGLGTLCEHFRKTLCIKSLFFHPPRIIETALVEITGPISSDSGPLPGLYGQMP